MIFRQSVDTNDYFIVTYDLEGSRSLRDAAWELAVGQSVGNPHVRNSWETDELFEKHSCKILGTEETLKSIKRGQVDIAFPIVNTNWREDGITQLMVQIMGGQLDIEQITYCRVIRIRFPSDVMKYFKGPKFGITGIRKYLNIPERPLVGAIVKPKTGITPDILLELVKELVEGGAEFIKEDEILSSPSFCTIEERLPIIMNYINTCGRKVIYAVCINSDYPYVIERVKRVYELGGNAVHVNFWNGLGIYKSIRELDIPLFVHFQKSGDKILTDKRHCFSISFSVISQLAGMMGVDFIHAGMWGGYNQTDENELKHVMSTLHEHNVMPALSCGMHPGIVNAIRNRFGQQFLANTGGAIHGHPMGTKAGTLAMKQALENNTEAEEYQCAIKKWGIVK